MERKTSRKRAREAISLSDLQNSPKKASKSMNLFGENPAEAFEAGMKAIRVGDDIEGEKSMRKCLEALETRGSNDDSLHILDDADLPTMVSSQFLTAECYLQLGEIYQSRGDMKTALESFQKSLQIRPNSVAAKVGVGNVVWLNATSDPHLKQVDSLLLEASLQEEGSSSMECPRDIKSRQEALRRRSLLLIQQNQPEQADSILSKLGYKLRLPDLVLRHSHKNTVSSPSESQAAVLNRIIAVTDEALPSHMLAQMRLSFVDNDSSTSQPPALDGSSKHPPLFWREHKYREVRGAYFSYAHRLGEKPQNGLDVIVHHILKIVTKFYPRVKDAKFAEWWAHRRPHSTGHQLHYDSEDEGKGEVRHPIVSTVLYLSEGVGGPTMVTDQRRDQALATFGALAFPKVNRLVAFDGSVLHGVIPGVGYSPSAGARRVTFMCAFWDTLNVRREATDPGPARLIPSLTTSHQRYTWIQMHKVIPSEDKMDNSYKRIWETVSTRDEKKDNQNGVPGYEACFQGI
ncbi:hypothetical protein AAMO2058_000724200 [Amorphochlora amoebiformis]